MRRIAILAVFSGVFALALYSVFLLRGESTPVLEQPIITEQKIISDSVHSYTVADVRSGCSVDDKIFCAVERAVKCTLVPEIEGCGKESVPGFVLSKPDVTDRPTEMAFSITKIKPVAGSSELYVYTNSTCNTVWFGLCEGTVVYALSPVANGWAVTNIYALEN